MSLVSERNTIMYAEDAKMVYLPVAAGKKIYQGALVVLNAAGYAEPGMKGTGLKAVGRAENTADNIGGADGACGVNVQRGVFVFDNTSVAADKIKQANLFDMCYILDDETVTMLGTGTSIAGKVIDITEDGIAVEIL